MNVSMAFGIALREARESAKLSQDELAGSAGLDRTFISLLETGKRQPSLQTIFDLSEALSISPVLLVRKAERILKPKK